MRVKINNGYLDVNIQGNGELVVLVPFPGRSAGDFQLLVNDLVKAGYRTAAINHRVMNGSKDNTDEITKKKIIDDIIAVIRSLKNGPAHLIGHSFSSCFVLLTASYKPEYVRSIITISHVNSLAPGRINPYSVLRRIISDNTPKDKYENNIKNAFFAEDSDSCVWHDGFQKKVLRNFYAGILSSTSQSEFLKIDNIPTLIIQGVMDKISPIQSASNMQDMFGENVQVEIIPNAGHQILHEQPTVLASRIVNFFTNIKNKEDNKKKESIAMFHESSKNNKSNFAMKLAILNYIIKNSEKKSFVYFLKPLFKIIDNLIKKEVLVVNYLLNRDIFLSRDRFMQKLKSGMHILDCACGPGRITIDFAKKVYPGEIIGIDERADMIKLAQILAKVQKVNNVKFVHGNINQINFNENEFDGVWIYNKQTKEIDKIIQNAYQFIKPGGLVAVANIDWKGNILYPEFRIINQIMKELERTLFSSGVNVYEARSYRSILNKAGFVNIEAAAFADSYATPRDTQELAESIIYSIKQRLPKKKTDIGIRMIENAWRAWAKHPDAYFSRTIIQAIGWKN